MNVAELPDASPAGAAPRRVDVVAGLLWHEGRLLVAQRLGDRRCANLWEFPGGKCEPGESDAEALGRELAEELGVEVVVGPLAWSVQHPQADQLLHLRFYHAALRHPAGPAPVAHCSQQVAWRAPQELTALPFCPADVPLLAQLAAGTLGPWTPGGSTP